MIKIFYGCARKHRLLNDQVIFIYNDIDKKCCCNYTCDIRDILSGKIKAGINLNEYEALIFTPPCNYYSRANYRRETSKIAQETKDLLPLCLEYCNSYGLPYLVENVCNKTLLGNLYPKFQFTIGNHTFWSNLLRRSDLDDLEFVKNQNKNFISPSKRNDNPNVDIVCKRFVEKVKKYYEEV